MVTLISNGLGSIVRRAYDIDKFNKSIRSNPSADATFVMWWSSLKHKSFFSLLITPPINDRRMVLVSSITTAALQLLLFDYQMHAF